MSWNYVFVFNLLSYLNPVIKEVDCGAKMFKKNLLSVSCFKVIKVFNSWLNEISISYL